MHQLRGHVEVVLAGSPGAVVDSDGEFGRQVGGFEGRQRVAVVGHGPVRALEGYGGSEVAQDDGEAQTLFLEVVLESDVGGGAPAGVARAVGFIQRFKRDTHLKLFGQLLRVGQRNCGLGVVEQSAGALGAELGTLFIGTRLQSLNAKAPRGASALDFAGGKDGALLEAATASHRRKADARSLRAGEAGGVVAQAPGITA